MVSVTAKVYMKDIDEVFKHISRVHKHLGFNIQCALTTSAETVKNNADTNLQSQLFADIPGVQGQSMPRPEQSIFTNWDLNQPIIYNDGIYEKKLINNSAHAAAVELGTMPPITPRHSEFLKFQLSDGRIVESLEVKGQPPKLYTTHAIEQSMKDITRMFSIAMIDSWRQIECPI
jgi:hypothetical protein